MSPNPTDAELIRQLNARAERSYPPMQLDSAQVITQGRRLRRRRALNRAAAGVAGIAAVAFGGAHLVASLDHEPVTVAELVTVDDVAVVAATDIAPLDPEAEPRPGTLGRTGTLYDTGVAVDPADPDGAHWVLEVVVLDPSDLPEGIEPEDTVMEFLAVRTHDADAGVSDWISAVPTTRGDGFADPDVEPGVAGLEGTQIAFGLAGIDFTPHLHLTEYRDAAPGRGEQVMIPTFPVPGVEGEVYLLRISGARPWPQISVYPSEQTGQTIIRSPE